MKIQVELKPRHYFSLFFQLVVIGLIGYFSQWSHFLTSLLIGFNLFRFLSQQEKFEIVGQTLIRERLFSLSGKRFFINDIQRISFRNTKSSRLVSFKGKEKQLLSCGIGKYDQKELAKFISMLKKLNPRLGLSNGIKNFLAHNGV